MKKEKEARFKSQMLTKSVRQKKLVDIGREYALEVSSGGSSGVSDHEVRQVFKKAQERQARFKPTLNLAQGLGDQYGSEDSDENEQRNSYVY